MIGVARLRRSLGVSRSGLVEEVAYFALSPRTFVIYGSFVLIASGLRAYRWTPDLGSVGLVVLVAVGVVALGAVVARALRAVMPKEHMWLAALLLWTAMPVVRHFAEVSVSQIEVVSQARVTGLTVLLSVASSLVWMFLIAGLQGVNALQRSTTEGLRIGVARLRSETEHRWAALDEERSRLAALVQRTIAPALKELIDVFSARDVVGPASGFADLASTIAEESRSLVREASHEMKHLADRSAKLGQPLFAEPEVVEIVPTKRPVLAAARARIEPASALVALLALGFAAPAPVPETLVRLLLAVMISFACLTGMAWMLPRLPLPKAWPPLVFVACGNAIGVAGGVFLSGALITSLVEISPVTVWLVPDGSRWLEVLVWGVGTVVTTAVSLIVADRRVWLDSAHQLARTRDALNALDVDMQRQYDRMAAQTAAMLHGPIQGRLATVGMTLRFVGDQITDEELADLDALLRECEEDLARAALDPYSERPSAWHVLDALRSQWSGLLEVTWSLTPEATDQINAEPILVRNLETLIADLASNASRHGGAKAVNFAISLTASHLRILARDNGNGPTFPVERGIGLGSLADDVPAISIDPDGWCCVTATISRGALEESAILGPLARPRKLSAS